MRTSGESERADGAIKPLITEKGDVGVFKFSGAKDFDLLSDVSRERSAMVPLVYCNGLSETDGSSHPSDTKNSSMRRTVSV